MDKNAGYEIKQAVLFDNGRGVALGENPKAPDPFVTWMFTQGKDGGRDYEWGHYRGGQELRRGGLLPARHGIYA